MRAEKANTMRPMPVTPRFGAMAFSLAAMTVALAAPALAQPIPGINIALSNEDRAVAATTTLDRGEATLQAPEDGDYGLIMQSELPVDARLTAVVRNQLWAVDLRAGPATRDAALYLPARAGDTINLCLEALEGARLLPMDGDLPVVCGAETTHGAGHQQ